MQRLGAFLKAYPSYGTFEAVLAMPYHRYVSALRIRRPDLFPEHFGRMTGQDALSEAERIIAQQQRNRERIDRERRGDGD